MKKLKASEEFIPGENNISYVWSGFKDHLYDLSFTREGTKLETRTLARWMNDSEIAKEFQPQLVTLGGVLDFLETADRTDWYIFYVNDSKGALWAVRAYWRDRGWDVEASSVSNPLRWFGGDRVVSRLFSQHPQPMALGDLEALSLPEILEINGIQYKKV